MYKNIVTEPDEKLLAKHGLTPEEHEMFFETDGIQYEINSNASQFYGASLADRNMLAQQNPGKTKSDLFLAKYKITWQTARAQLLDRMNNYALEFYNFRKPLGSPNGKNFW